MSVMLVRKAKKVKKAKTPKEPMIRSPFHGWTKQDWDDYLFGWRGYSANDSSWQESVMTGVEKAIQQVQE